MERYILCLICLISLMLDGCSSITRELALISEKEDYPSAQAKNVKELRLNPNFHLDLYQSVQTPTRPFQRSDIAIAIAASGGGYRAANLAAGVLLGLEEIHYPELKGNLLEEVDYFSTASGGGFPVALYLSQLAKFQKEKGINEHFSYHHLLYEEKGLEKLAIDYSADLFFGKIRSYRLESRLGQNLLSISPHQELVLGDVFIPKKSQKNVTLPLWIANATIFQNMAILPFTPDILEKYAISAYNHDYSNHNIPENKDPAYYGENFPFAVAITASASYPYALMGTTLSSRACDPECYLQLFDGGLADNLGVSSAIKLLDQDKSPIKILIIIDAFKGENKPYSRWNMPPGQLTLLSGVVNSGTSSFRQHINNNANTLIPAVLCHSGTKRILTAYLDISDYPKAQQIGTHLWTSAEEQALLIETGKKLVRENNVLNQLVKKALAGDLKIGHC